MRPGGFEPLAFGVSCPAKTLTALGAIGGHFQKIILLAPLDVALQLVDPLVGTAKLTGAAQIGGQHAGRCPSFPPARGRRFGLCRGCRSPFSRKKRAAHPARWGGSGTKLAIRPISASQWPPVRNLCLFVSIVSVLRRGVYQISDAYDIFRKFLPAWPTKCGRGALTALAL